MPEKVRERCSQRPATIDHKKYPRTTTTPNNTAFFNSRW
jgi:hypothetical protein